jgi:hypothetical protein
MDICSFFFLFLCFGIVFSDPICTSEYASGYYCLSSSQLAWCYGVETPAIYACNSPLTCKCGYSTENPCAWFICFVFCDFFFRDIGQLMILVTVMVLQETI